MSSGAETRSLEALIQAIRAATVRNGLDSPGGLMSPAGVSAIERFENAHGVTFPPSYREFLQLHNGWEGYVDGFTLIGVDGAHTENALADIELTVDSFLDAWSITNGEPDPEKIRAYESRGDLSNPLEAEYQPYLPTKLHFGTNFNGGVRFFNPDRVDAAGEMEVWCWTTGQGTVCRHDTFVKMLRADLERISHQEN